MNLIAQERRLIMLIKNVNVNNPKNVLVQIPSFVIRTWEVKKYDVLEVHFDEKTEEITIRPHNLQDGSAANKEG